MIDRHPDERYDSPGATGGWPDRCRGMDDLAGNRQASRAAAPDRRLHLS